MSLLSYNPDMKRCEISTAEQEKIEKISLFFLNQKPRWAQMEMNDLNHQSLAAIAISTLPAAVNAMFESDIDFEHWIDCALLATPSRIEGLMPRWGEALIQLSHQKDSIARAYLEDMLSVTSEAALQERAKDGRSWADVLSAEMDMTHGAWDKVIEALVIFKHQPVAPFLTEIPRNPGAPDFDQSYAGSITFFTALINKNTAAAMQYLDELSPLAKAHVIAANAREIAHKIPDLLHFCEAAPEVAMKHSRTWIEAMSELAKKPKHHPVVDRMANLFPIQSIDAPFLFGNDRDTTRLDLLIDNSQPIIVQHGNQFKAQLEAMQIASHIGESQAEQQRLYIQTHPFAGLRISEDSRLYTQIAEARARTATQKTTNKPRL